MDRIPITIFTDGSCNVKSPYKLGGFGVYLQAEDGEMFLRRGFFNTTTSRMEMKALLSAVKMIDPDVYTHVTIISDSNFVVESFRQGYLAQWRRNGWGGVKNQELWKEILYEIERRRKMLFGIAWTPGHQTDMTVPYNYGNAIADALADYKSQDKYFPDVTPLKDYAYYYHEGSDFLFVERSDDEGIRKLDSIGDVICIGDCKAATREELNKVIKGKPFLEDMVLNGKCEISLELSNYATT